MAFLAWYFVPQAYVLLVTLIIVLYRKLKKREIHLGKLVYRGILSLGLAFVLGFFIALTMQLCFPRISFLDGAGIFLFLSFVCRFLDIPSLFGRPAERLKARTNHLASIVLGVFVLLEAFAFNVDAYNVGNGPVYVGEETSVSIVQSPADSDTERGMMIDDEGDFVIEKGETEYETLYVRMDMDHEAQIDVTLYFGDDLSSLRDDELSHDYTLSSHSDDSMVMAIPSDLRGYPYVMVYIEFEDTRDVRPECAYVSTVAFDMSRSFSFSYLRAGSFTLIALCVAYLDRVAATYKEDRKKVGKLPYIVIGVSAVIALAGLFAFASTDIQRYYVSYPLTQDILDSQGRCNIYTRLFDAFNKGQLYLDVTVPEKLLTVENPWSSQTWHDEGIRVLWDHAYYDGHYYCYYGPAPVLLVMFPIYYLSGCTLIPDIFLIQCIGTILEIAAFALVLLEIHRLVGKDKVHWPAYWLSLFMGLIISMAFSLVTYKKGAYYEGIYRAPISYALFFVDLFLSLVLMAYRDRKHAIYYLMGAGVSIIGVVASRPSDVIVAAFSIPFFLSILLDKERKWGRKILDFVPAGTIVLLGLVGIFAYNGMRFDSIFEFGQKYQMNYDQTGLTYSLDKVFPSMIHFLFQHPNFYDEFPYVSCSVYRLSFDDGLYFNGYYGLCMVPFFLFMFVGPFASNKAIDRPTRWFIGLFIPVVLVWCYMTYSLAGICARYLVEPYHLAYLGSLASMLGFLEKGETAKGRKTTLGLGLAAGAVSCFICLCLLFDTFDGWKAADFFGIPQAIKEAFLNFN